MVRSLVTAEMILYMLKGDVFGMANAKRHHLVNGSTATITPLKYM